VMAVAVASSTVMAQGNREGRQGRGNVVAAPVAPVVVAHATTGRVFVDWAPLRGADGYKIFRGVNGVWATEPIATLRHSRFRDRAVTNGVPHAYKVLAFNTGGNGPPSNVAGATPVAPPTEITATGGDRQVTLAWRAAPGATAYGVLRRTGATNWVLAAPRVTATTFTDTGLTNGIEYFYRLRSFAPNAESVLSDRVSAKPMGGAPTVAPALQLSSAPGAITLAWNAVSGATSYKIFRSTTGTFALLTTVTATAFTNDGLVNGTTYSYKVAGANLSGDGPMSDQASATPTAPLAAPTNLSATPGDAAITLSWTPVDGATGYNVYRGTSSNGQAAIPVGPNVTMSAFADTPLVNGTPYFYKVTALKTGVESPRSTEATATPAAPPPTNDPTTLSAFRLLRQATWGPKPGDVDHVKTVGVNAFLDEQFGAASSGYPDALYDQPVELAQEQFMANALTGQDQLRQRMAWALHKIWVVSAIEIDQTRAIIPYYRILSSRAFGNYKDVMKDITLNPAMGRYLNMVNNRSQAITGAPANENYARELLQLFTWGTVKLNPNGTPEGGVPAPTYTEADVKALARVFTGWTYGDGNPATIPTGTQSQNFLFPMEPVARYHDITPKTFMGEDFPPNVDARTELDHALDVIFDHANVAPFVSRQLIQQLVTSNPSAQYVADIAAVFGAPGSPSRGDLQAVVRAILTHPEAAMMTTTSGKLSEPVLFALSMVRALNATVTDHPFLSDLTANMGQRVFYPGSVFSYHSPGYKVRNTGTPPLGGPEFQTLTTVTALERANFVASLLGGSFGTDVTFNFDPFTSRASNPAALVDYVNEVLMGGRMSAQQRNEIVATVTVTPATNAIERARTALYLTWVAGQSQVDN